MDEGQRENWQVVARRSVADRSPWLHLWEEDVRLPDGRVVPGFNVIEMPDVAIIVALTTGGAVVIERSYKHGAGRVCINLPAGYLEPGKEPLLAAQRELREETGYAANVWQSLGAFVTDGNRGCGRTHLFLARDARQVTEADAGDLETIAVELMPLGELVREMFRGEVASVPIATAIALAALTVRDEE